MSEMHKKHPREQITQPKSLTSEQREIKHLERMIWKIDGAMEEIEMVRSDLVDEIERLKKDNQHE